MALIAFLRFLHYTAPSVAEMTFLFTDIEGSTRLWQQQPEAMRRLLARHDALLRSTIEQSGGGVFKMMGDACFARFDSPEAAVHAAVAAQRLLRQELPQLRVRMALHAGEAEERDGDYFGPALNHLARLLAAGHGGQILLSGAVAKATRHRLPEKMALRPLGTHRLRDIEDTESIFQLQPPGLPSRFPPLNTLNVVARRGAVRTGSVAVVVLAIVASLAGIAVRQRNRAEAQREIIRRSLYVSDMNLASRAIQEGDLSRALVLLGAHRPTPGELDLRGWEWRYLWGRCQDRSLFSLRGSTDSGLGLNALAVSHDGRLLAAGGYDPTVFVWDLHTHLLLRALNCQSERISSVLFSPDGNALVSGGAGGTARVWRVSDGNLLSAIRGSSRTLAAFSPDGSTLATAGVNHSGIRLWRIAAGGYVAPKPAVIPLQDWAVSLAFSPDGRLLAVGGRNGMVRIWSCRTRALVAAARGYVNWVRSLAFSPDARRLASGSEDGTVKLWSVPGLRNVRTITGHASPVRAAAFSPDGRTLASGSADHSVRLWDPRTCQLIGVLHGRQCRVGGMTFTPDGTQLLTANGDGSVTGWSPWPPADEEVLSADPHADGGALAFSTDGEWLAFASTGNAIKLWDVPHDKEAGILKGHQTPVSDLAVSPDGRILASGSSDRTIRLWDVSARRQVAVLSGLVPAAFFGSRFSPHGRFLAAKAWNGDLGPASEIKIWDLSAHRYVAALRGRRTSIMQMVFSADSRLFFTADLDGTLRRWSTAGWTERGAYHLLPMPEDLARSPDGRLLALPGANGDIDLWDTTRCRALTTLKGHRFNAVAVGFTRDGRTLASLAQDGSLKLWSIAAQRELCSFPVTLEGHGAVTAFSPDGNTLALSLGHTIHLWRAPSFAETDGPASARRKP